jgi:hypothetical protein
VNEAIDFGGIACEVGVRLWESVVGFARAAEPAASAGTQLQSRSIGVREECRYLVMHDFVKFFGAVAAGWVFLMSGISVCVALWLRLRRRSDIATAPFWVIAAICVLFAFFLAWRGEQRGRIAAESTVQEMATPHLQGSIEQIDVGHIKSTDELQSVVLVWLGVRNQGADSIADGYHLQVMVDGHEIGQWPPWKISRNIHFEDFGVMLPLEAGNGSIYEKTVDHAIPRGSQVKGLLMFIIRGIPMSTLTRSSVTYKVLFHDVKDKICIASHVMTRQPYTSYPVYVPGTPEFQSESEFRARKHR